MSAWSLTTTQRDALVAFVRRATGLGAAAVLWAPYATAAGLPAQRPALPYVTLAITSPPRELGSPSVSVSARNDATDSTLDPIGVTDVVAQQNAPPGSPSAGDVYLVGASPTGSWSGQANKIATYGGSSWTFTTATAGDRVWTASDASLRFGGVTWASEADQPLERATSHRALTLTLNAYARTAASNQSAAYYIDRCMTALRMSATADSLAAVGLGAASILSMRASDPLVDETFETRAAVDVRLHLATRGAAAVDVIETVNVTGTVSTLSVPVTIDLGV